MDETPESRVRRRRIVRVLGWIGIALLALLMVAMSVLNLARFDVQREAMDKAHTVVPCSFSHVAVAGGGLRLVFVLHFDQAPVIPGMPGRVSGDQRVGWLFSPFRSLHAEP